MVRIYCKVTNCKWNRERNVVNACENAVKYTCARNYIHLSHNGICLDFRGTPLSTPRSKG